LTIVLYIFATSACLLSSNGHRVCAMCGVDPCDDINPAHSEL